MEGVEVVRITRTWMYFTSRADRTCRKEKEYLRWPLRFGALFRWGK
jgi:hypothetical protein